MIHRAGEIFPYAVLPDLVLLDTILPGSPRPLPSCLEQRGKQGTGPYIMMPWGQGHPVNRLADMTETLPSNNLWMQAIKMVRQWG